jgi:predicted nucleic acid-binding protein
MGSPRLSSIAEALDGVTALGVDTAPLIYFIEQHPVYAGRLRMIIERFEAGQLHGYTSVITLTEVLTRPREIGAVDLVAAYRAVLLNSRNFTLVPIDATIADQAADLRARYRLRTPDALQLAVALAAGCQAFLTNDRQMRRITELRVLLLDDLTE